MSETPDYPCVKTLTTNQVATPSPTELKLASRVRENLSSIITTPSPVSMLPSSHQESHGRHLRDRQCANPQPIQRGLLPSPKAPEDIECEIYGQRNDAVDVFVFH